MVMMTVKKSVVRTSVSVLAMVFSASVALADGEPTTAIVAVETEGFEPVVTECGFGFEPEVIVEIVPEDGVDETTGIDGDKDVTIETDEGGEEVVYTPIEPIEIEDGENPEVYYMTSGGVDDVDLVKRNDDLAKVAVHSAQAAHDPASVPNLCDVPGVKMNWLCGAKTQ